MQQAHRILIVDDEPMIRLVLRHTLEAVGYRVEEATNGLEALAMLSRDRHGISVVVSDVSMPVMDGFELAHRMRSLSPSVPVVLASGGYSRPDGRYSSGFSPESVVEKPYSCDTVLAAIANAIASR